MQNRILKLELKSHFNVYNYIIIIFSLLLLIITFFWDKLYTDDFGQIYYIITLFVFTYLYSALIFIINRGKAKKITLTLLIALEHNLKPEELITQTIDGRRLEGITVRNFTDYNYFLINNYLENYETEFKEFFVEKDISSKLSDDQKKKIRKYFIIFLLILILFYIILFVIFQLQLTYLSNNYGITILNVINFSIFVIPYIYYTKVNPFSLADILILNKINNKDKISIKDIMFYENYNTYNGSFLNYNISSMNDENDLPYDIGYKTAYYRLSEPERKIFEDIIAQQLKSFRFKYWKYFMVFTIGLLPSFLFAFLNDIGQYLELLYFFLWGINFIHYTRKHERTNEPPIYQKGWLKYLVSKGEIVNQNLADLDLKKRIYQYLQNKKSEKKENMEKDQTGM